MNKRKIKINAILTLVILVALIILAFCIFDIVKKLKNQEQKEVEIIDTIDNYNYVLTEYDSKYFETLFEELKSELNKDELDEDKYAELLAKLFTVDFYSLQYSLSKNDVGGKQFVFETYQSDFVKKAKETIYATVESNIYGERKQELPNVSNIEITSIENTEFETENFEDENAYNIELEIAYEKDLEYPETLKLILVHNNDKLEIAQMN